MTLARIQSYAVTCPECRGTRYLPGQQSKPIYAKEGETTIITTHADRYYGNKTSIGILCWRCNGEGQIVIPEVVKQPINLRGPILLCLAIILVGLALAKVWGMF